MDAPIAPSEVEAHLDGPLKAAFANRGYVLLNILASPERFQRLVHILVKYPHELLRQALGGMALDDPQADEPEREDPPLLSRHTFKDWFRPAGVGKQAFARRNKRHLTDQELHDAYLEYAVLLISLACLQLGKH